MRFYGYRCISLSGIIIVSIFADLVKEDYRKMHQAEKEVNQNKP